VSSYGTGSLGAIWATSASPNSGGSSRVSALRYAEAAAAITFIRIRGFRAPLSLQPRNREAKPYQISQFLDMVREFNLPIEHRQ
jgi:hypothetical protein